MMQWLLESTVLALVLAMLAMAVGRWLKPRPALMHWLWLFVLLRLGCPPWTAWAEVPTTTLDLAALPTAQAIAWLAPTPAPTTSTSPNLGRVLLTIWLIGSAALLVIGGAGVRRMHRRVRAASAAEDTVLHDVSELATLLGVRAPSAVTCAWTASPFVWSLGRATVVVPADFAHVPKARRRALLAHELAHLRRRDHWIVWLEALLVVALWWHPLLWLARTRMREQAELSCDAWALWAVPGARLDYAQALIAALEHESIGGGATVLAVRSGAGAAFERRLTMILHEPVPCRLSRAAALPLLGLALAFTATPMLAQGERRAPRIEVKVNGKDLSELTRAERQALRAAMEAAEANTDEDREPRPDSPPGFEPVELEDLGSTVRNALQEARAEVLHDEDLRELGIADDVAGLLDSLGDGKKFQHNLQNVIVKAMHGAARQATEEIRADPELEALGIADGVAGLVQSLAENDAIQESLMDLTNQAMRGALDMARTEIRSDPDLRRLGLTNDVEAMVGGVLGEAGAPDFNQALSSLVQKAMRAAMQEAAREAVPAQPTRKPKKTPARGKAL